MNKTLVTSGITITILVFCLLIMLFPFFSEIKDHHPIASSKIIDNLCAVNTGISNFYIITNGETDICIDAGSSLKKAKQELLKLNINPDLIEIVFLTHSDQDHTAALSLFKNAQIYLSIDEEQMILNKRSRFFGFIKNKLPDTYYLLNDGSEMNIGDIKVRALATPGHTSGSMSYLVNGQMLFTGDTLSLKDGKTSLFSPHFFNMDEKSQENSIRKLASLRNITLLCTGHHGVTDKFESAMEEWRK